MISWSTALASDFVKFLIDSKSIGAVGLGSMCVCNAMLISIKNRIVFDRKAANPLHTICSYLLMNSKLPILLNKGY